MQRYINRPIGMIILDLKAGEEEGVRGVFAGWIRRSDICMMTLKKSNNELGPKFFDLHANKLVEKAD